MLVELVFGDKNVQMVGNCDNRLCDLLKKLPPEFQRGSPKFIAYHDGKRVEEMENISQLSCNEHGKVVIILEVVENEVRSPDNQQPEGYYPIQNGYIPPPARIPKENPLLRGKKQQPIENLQQTTVDLFRSYSKEEQLFLANLHKTTGIGIISLVEVYEENMHDAERVNELLWISLCE